MPLHVWIAFFIASWLISLSPGVGAISCMAAGLRHGYRRALWNIVGLQLGILVILALVALGLGAAIAASATLFAAIKWFGAAYLVGLGVQQMRSRSAPVGGGGASAGAGDPRKGTPRALVLRGFLVNATNPKGIVFLLAVLPQFIDPRRPQLLQYLICAATLTFTDIVVMSGYTGLAAQGLRLLREPHHLRALNRVFGGLFIAAGLALAAFRRG
ncbi:MAG: LysE family transporter [Proteobacteria bacterium]|nr:LysE family transporter [Pseudomonadota bacterium]